MTGDVDFAQFHSVSMLVEDTMPPMLETLQQVDKTFRERPHLDSGAVTAYVNDTNFSVEFLTPNCGSGGNAGRAAKMPALGGASAQALRYLNFLSTKPINMVLLHKGGVPVAVPTPERYAVHKLIVSLQRNADARNAAKARKDVLQTGLLIEALALNSMQSDLGFVWMEAWERGPRWRENLSLGSKQLASEHRELLRAAVREACRHDGKALRDYGFDADRDDDEETAPLRDGTFAVLMPELTRASRPMRSRRQIAADDFTWIGALSPCERLTRRDTEIAPSSTSAFMLCATCVQLGARIGVSATDESTVTGSGDRSRSARRQWKWPAVPA